MLAACCATIRTLTKSDASHAIPMICSLHCGPMAYLLLWNHLSTLQTTATPLGMISSSNAICHLTCPDAHRRMLLFNIDPVSIDAAAATGWSPAVSPDVPRMLANALIYCAGGARRCTTAPGSVLLVLSETDSYGEDVRMKLLENAQAACVDLIGARNPTQPVTLALLQNYSSVLVSSPAFADARAVGDALGAYVDGGGGVVISGLRTSDCAARPL